MQDIDKRYTLNTSIYYIIPNIHYLIRRRVRFWPLFTDDEYFKIKKINIFFIKFWNVLCNQVYPWHNQYM